MKKLIAGLGVGALLLASGCSKASVSDAASRLSAPSASDSVRLAVCIKAAVRCSGIRPSRRNSIISTRSRPRMR